MSLSANASQPTEVPQADAARRWIREYVLKAVVDEIVKDAQSVDDIAREALVSFREKHHDVFLSIVQSVRRSLAESVVRCVLDGDQESGLDEGEPGVDPEAMAGMVDQIRQQIQQTIDRSATPEIARSSAADEPSQQRSETPKDEQEEPSAPAGARSVLLVDDNKDIRTMLLHFLKGKYDLVAVSSPGEALQAAKDKASAGEAFELLLLDIHLGGEMTGCDLLGELRTLPHHESVPAIAFTAFASPEDIMRYMTAGFLSLVKKPVTRETLLGALDRAFREA